MSSGIILRQQADWIVSGWAAEAAVEYIRRFLNERECNEVVERLTAVGLYPGSLANFTDATNAQVRQLYRAALQGYEAARTEGPRDWHQPEFFPGFLDRFGELIDMIASDPRLRD